MTELGMLVTMLFEQAITAFKTPVLNFPFTYWDVAIGVFVVNVSLRIINYFFGGVLGGDDVGGNSKNIRVSNEREDDE